MGKMQNLIKGRKIGENKKSSKKIQTLEQTNEDVNRASHSSSTSQGLFWWILPLIIPAGQTKPIVFDDGDDDDDIIITISREREANTYTQP